MKLFRLEKIMGPLLCACGRRLTSGDPRHLWYQALPDDPSPDCPVCGGFFLRDRDDDPSEAWKGSA